VIEIVVYSVLNCFVTVVVVVAVVVVVVAVVVVEYAVKRAMRSMSLLSEY
jgi:hypothetical protein